MINDFQNYQFIQIIDLKFRILKNEVWFNISHSNAISTWQEVATEFVGSRYRICLLVIQKKRGFMADTHIDVELHI